MMQVANFQRSHSSGPVKKSDRNFANRPVPGRKPEKIENWKKEDLRARAKMGKIFWG
jgi:hypothetical protein